MDRSSLTVCFILSILLMRPFSNEPFSLSISLFEASDALKATFFLPVSHISYPLSFDIALILMNVRSACYI